MNYFLKSERLGFRRWTDADLPLAVGLWGDPEVTKFIGGPFTLEMVQVRLAKGIAQGQKCGLQYWPIFLLGGDEHVGCAGLRPYRDDERIYELGFHLRRAFWGRGLAKEAAIVAIGYAFDVAGANALFAGHHAENKASRELLLKLGFVHTGEELYPPTGLMESAYLLRKK